MTQPNSFSILLGNGISRLLNGLSWEEMLEKLFGKLESLKDACPKPLQTDLLNGEYWKAESFSLYSERVPTSRPW